MDFVHELQSYIKARYSLILVKTDEEDRLSTDLAKTANILDHRLITWSIASGLKENDKPINEASVELRKAIDVCEDIAKEGNKLIFVFYDVVVHQCQTYNICIVFVSRYSIGNIAYNATSETKLCYFAAKNLFSYVAYRRNLVGVAYSEGLYCHRIFER